jgi:hypothetical protein
MAKTARMRCACESAAKQRRGWADGPHRQLLPSKSAARHHAGHKRTRRRIAVRTLTIDVARSFNVSRAIRQPASPVMACAVLQPGSSRVLPVRRTARPLQAPLR